MRIDWSKISKLAYALIDLLNFDQTCNFLLKSDSYMIFLELEKLCTQNDRLQMRDKLVQSMFVRAVKNNQDSIALHMSIEFVSLLLRCTAIVVPPILAKIEKDLSQFNEI